MPASLGLGASCPRSTWTAFSAPTLIGAFAERRRGRSVRGPDHPRSGPRLFLVTPPRQRAVPPGRWRDQDCPIIRLAIRRASGRAKLR
jgi:hypothetical protein